MIIKRIRIYRKQPLIINYRKIPILNVENGRSLLQQNQIKRGHFNKNCLVLGIVYQPAFVP